MLAIMTIAEGIQRMYCQKHKRTVQMKDNNDLVKVKASQSTDPVTAIGVGDRCIVYLTKPGDPKHSGCLITWGT